MKNLSWILIILEALEAISACEGRVNNMTICDSERNTTSNAFLWDQLLYFDCFSLPLSLLHFESGPTTVS